MTVEEIAEGLSPLARDQLLTGRADNFPNEPYAQGCVDAIYYPRGSHYNPRERGKITITPLGRSVASHLSKE